MADIKKAITKKTTVKKVVAKPVAKAAVKTPAKKVIVKPEVKKESSLKVSLKVKVFDVAGKETGSMSLPEAIFGTKPNKTLLAQAVRVYLANQRQGNASTKTRSEVTGSRKKVWKQKGTGRARHGSITGPIFVGGGITFGPRPHDFSLEMPKRMRKVALFSALSQKLSEGKIMIVDGDFTGKTKQVAMFLKTLGLADKKGNGNKILIITNKDAKMTRQAASNIMGVNIETSESLNVYPVINSKNVLITKESIEELVKMNTKKRLTNI